MRERCILRDKGAAGVRMQNKTTVGWFPISEALSD